MNRQDKRNSRESAEVGRLDKKVRRLNKGLSSVYQTSKLLTSPMDLEAVLEVVVKTIADVLGVDAAGLRLLDEETGALILKATHGLSDEYRNKGPITAGESFLNRKALNGEAIIVDDICTDPHYGKYRAEAHREGLVSTMSIGLIYRDKGIGILRLYSKRQRHFSPEDVSLARTVAAQSAAAIVNAKLYKEALEGERMARQVRLAGAVQRHLIPRQPPKVAGLELAGIYVPCYDLGGDFYDFIQPRQNRLVLAIGDVMGKGVPASLAMASVRSSLRAFAEEIDEIEKLVSRVNRMFCHDTELGEFATLFCGEYDVLKNQLTYCNCGHERPILIHGREVIDLAEGGPVLGLSEDSQYRAGKIDLQVGDVLIMYTDGLSDAINFRRESFGRERIIEAALTSISSITAEQIAKNIIWLMRKFTGLTQRFDDTALVVLKRTKN